MYKKFIQKITEKITGIGKLPDIDIKLNSRLFLNEKECTLKYFHTESLQYTATIKDKGLVDIVVDKRKYVVKVIQEGVLHSLTYEFEETAWQEDLQLEDYIEGDNLSKYRLNKIDYDIELLILGKIQSEIGSIFKEEESIQDTKGNYLETFGLEIHHKNRGI